MTPKEFREKLNKAMPGYKWTVHNTKNPEKLIDATGIQSSGFNRLSTLSVCRTLKNDMVFFSVKSAANGTNSPWEHSCSDTTLARALRGLQNHYERQASYFHGLAAALQSGRTPKDQS